MATRTRIRPIRTDLADPNYPTTHEQKLDVNAAFGNIYGPVAIPAGARIGQLEIVSGGPNTILDEPSTTLIFVAIDIDLTGSGGWFRKIMSEWHGYGDVTHTVASGETLASIAALYRITEQALADRNGLNVGDPVVAGQVLNLVPRGGHLIGVSFRPEDVGRPIRATITNNARVRFGIDAVFFDANGNPLDVF